MVHFPLIERLSVQGYDLYPGAKQNGELTFKMGKGPWLVLGVNGLGKSTLLLLLRYLLTGPFRTRGVGFAGEREDLMGASNRFFAVRVADGATEAVATIVVAIGDARLTVKRSLADLALADACIERGRKAISIETEEAFQDAVANLMGVAHFADWVRVLDHLVFNLENRMPLVWDVSAQFELFRALLTPNLSSDLRRFEGEIVSADSTARNLNATLFKISQQNQKEARRRAGASDTRARISAVQGELDALFKREQELNKALEAAETELSDHDLQRRRAEKSVEEAAQEYESLKFDVLRQSFAGIGPNEQYILLKLVSESICHACSQPAEEFATELQKRSEQDLCVVCGQPRHSGGKVQQISASMREKASKAYEMLEAARYQLKLHKEQFVQTNERRVEVRHKLLTARSSIDQKQSDIRRLRKNLPAAESAELLREENRMITLREEVQKWRQIRDEAELEIDQLLTQLRQATEQVREKLETAFLVQAKPFFGSQARLVYAPRTAKIGQGGRSFEFPAFEVEMTSGTTLGQFIRRTPDQVSLSQREYLDLIFRMMLIEVLGDITGSLVVDGPEGSLDAVFSGLAGDLFSDFSKKGQTNVLLACNIIEGDFIPRTLKRYKTSGRRTHVLNLMEQARPTETLQNLQHLYREKVEKILSEDGA